MRLQEKIKGETILADRHKDFRGILD
ncbi:MAG: NADH-quinone oxidoreductase subunit B, partial [Desulfobacterales bacterium]